MPVRTILDRLPIWLKVFLVLAALYLFLVGIGSMGAAFKMMGKSYTEDLLGTTGGPLISLFIGILATTLLQSSSTTTSLVVGLVAAGAIPFHSAIYMVMGANVGTTVTNTIVSLGHITRSNEYHRAFAAATVHDFFNMLVLLVLFPLEISTGAIDWLSRGATSAFKGIGGLNLASPIKLVTKPAIQALQDLVSTAWGGGWLLLVVAVLFTFGGLIFLVTLLRNIMAAKLGNLFDRVIFKSARRGLVFGLLLTIFVQSSSITTSIAIPLVGAGILTIQQILPYTMGANIGTTATALLAALAAYAAADSGDPESVRHATLGLHVAFYHVLFNVLGVAMGWWVRWLPISIAEGFARLALWNRMIPFLYIVITFYVAPFLIIWIGR
ncbi:MAG: Na/Pi symporter [Acidobacteriota bacterium]